MPSPAIYLSYWLFKKTHALHKTPYYPCQFGLQNLLNAKKESNKKSIAVCQQNDTSHNEAVRVGIYMLGP